MQTLCLFLALGSLASPADPPPLQDDGDGVLRAYDLRAVLPSHDATGWSQALFVDPVWTTERIEDTPLGGVHERAAAEVVVDLLTQVLGDELRYEGRMVSLESDDRLLVVAPPAVQRRIRTVLDGLRGALRANVELQVEVFALEDGAGVELPPGNVLEADAGARLAASLAGAGASRETHRLHLAAGRTSWVDASERHSFVGDYEVEIAQGSMIFDPAILEAEAGTRIVLRGVPVEGGVLLSAVLRSSAVPRIVDREVRLAGLISFLEGSSVAFVDGPSKLQVAESWLSAVAFDTFLPDGRVLLATTRARIGDEERRQVVLLRRVGGQAAPYHAIQVPQSSRRLLVVNAELPRPPRLAYVEDADPWSHHLEQRLLGAELDAAPSLFLFDWVKRSFPTWRRMGPWALAVTDPSWDGTAQEDLEDLLADLAVDERLVELEASVTEEGSPGAGAFGFRLPVRSGAGCAVMVGRTRQVLVDHEVEVAQMAAVADPVHLTLFEGLALRLASSPDVEGGAGRADDPLGLDVRGFARLVSEAERSLELGGPQLGAVDLPRFSDLHVDDALRLSTAEGRPATVRLGEGGPLALEISVR